MTWSFPAGFLFGAELRVHATFVLLLLWITVSSFLDGGVGAGLFDGLFVIALFASIVAHEIGHLWVARQYNVQAKRVTLLPIGGVPDADMVGDTPVQDIAIALAGPSVSLGLWIVLSIFESAPAPSNVFSTPNADTNYLHLLALANLYLALFNLLPAFPMDGGRILRALLVRNMVVDEANRIATMAGQFIGFGIGLWGLIDGTAGLVLVALFIFLSSTLASPVAVDRNPFEDISIPRSLLNTRFESLSIHDTIETAVAISGQTSQQDFPVFDEDRFIGFLTRDSLAVHMNQTGNRTEVGDYVTTNAPIVQHSSSIEDVRRALEEQDTRLAAVATATGDMIGYVTLEKIKEFQKANRERL